MPTLNMTKRLCEEDVEGGRPLKRRRVVFAENSSLRHCEIAEIEIVAGSCEVESIGVDGQRLTGESLILEESSLLGLDLTEDSVSDTQTKTKTQDGPAPATLVTNALIHALKRNRSMKSSQVADFLREAATATSSPPAPARADAEPPEPLAVSLACPLPATSHAPLCLAVHDRLRALSDRIEARGKASILPCTTNLHRPFLPALQFLLKAVVACVSAGEQHALMEQG